MADDDTQPATPAQADGTQPDGAGRTDDGRGGVTIPSWMAAALVVVLALSIGAVGFALGRATDGGDERQFQPIGAQGQEGREGRPFPGGPGERGPEGEGGPGFRGGPGGEGGEREGGDRADDEQDEDDQADDQADDQEETDESGTEDQGATIGQGI